jgi:hypothetical protein
MVGKRVQAQHGDKEKNHASRFDHWLRPLHHRL